jgi:MinD-like ATPase involved in chromosome partitioning or flagellar assembly
MTKVVTFYSYKGGVGRTMALVNTAHVLARDGWRVLMVDLDLEAPGMTHFFADWVREQARPTSKDALDLLLEAKQTLPEVEPEKRKFKKVSLEDYVIGIPLPNAWMETEGTGSPYRNGRLDLLPATLEPTLIPEPNRGYLERMDALDLPGIFSVEGPRHRFGDHLRRYFTHARFEAPGDILFTMRETVQAAYDVVLVDSRTGLNEISGLSVGPLSDALVICTGLNQQNVEGTRYFMEKAGLLDKERSKPYVVVVGPVPPWQESVTSKRASQIGTLLKVRDLTKIPYHPMAAIVETIFVIDVPGEPITKAYEQLAPKIAELAQPRSDPEQAFESASLGSWDRRMVERLPSWRLGHGHKWDLGTIYRIPTGATIQTVRMLPARRIPTDKDAEQIAVGAAISAYRLKSAAPFERIWRIVHRPDARHLWPGLTMHLLFMQLRVLGELPQNVDVSRVLEDAKHDHARDSSSSFWIVSTYATDLGVIAGTHQPVPKSSPVPYRLWLGYMHSGWKGEHWMREALGVLMSDMSWLKSELPDKTRGALEKVLKGSEKWVSDLRHLGEGKEKERFQRMIHDYWMEQRHDHVLGAWPFPLMLSAVSLVKGPYAIDEILTWLDLCCLFHGYAWRVLVDWRHLEHVREHPKFVAFMRDEDAQVDKIEAAIDRGRYPL